MLKTFFSTLLVLLLVAFAPQPYSYKLALLKYNGGGDWYSNPTALSNLILFTNQNLGTDYQARIEKSISRYRTSGNTTLSSHI